MLLESELAGKKKLSSFNWWSVGLAKLAVPNDLLGSRRVCATCKQFEIGGPVCVINAQ